MIDILNVLLDFVPKLFSCTPFLFFVACVGVAGAFTLVFKLIYS